MARPTTAFGYPDPWVNNPDGTPVAGMSVYDTDPASLPPLTAALRNAWGSSTAHPVASGAAMAAIFAAIHDLETRVIALETP